MPEPHRFDKAREFRLSDGSTTASVGGLDGAVAKLAGIIETLKSRKTAMT